MKFFIQLSVLIFVGIEILCAQAPTIPTRSLSLTQITGHSVKIEMQPGDGERRLILARKSAPVDALPENDKTYTSKSEFGTGAQLNGQTFVVFSGSLANVVITNLEPNTVYHFACFEFNNSASPSYMQTAATTSFRTNAGPTLPAAAATTADIEGNSLKIITNGGDGSRRLIILKKGSPPTAIPQNGQLYREDGRFGSGQEIAAGEFVVQNGGENTTTVTQLEPGSTYFVRIYTYDADATGFAYYLTDKFLATQASTVSRPNYNAQVTLAEVTGNSARFLFDDAGGKYRIITMRQNESVTGKPVDLVRYAGGNKDFGKGAQLGAGNYIIAGSTNGNEFTVTNLKAGQRYYAEICEFNGYYAPVYLTPGAIVKIDIPAEPDKPASNLTVQQVENNSLRPAWKNGSGARRIVVARKGEPVTAMPEDGQTYKPDAIFGNGSKLSDGQFVVYDGTDAGFSLKGLEALSAYHLAIFEYNLPDDQPDYRTSTYLSGIVVPGKKDLPSSNATVLEREGNQFRLRWDSGSGARRLVIAREGAAPEFRPLNGSTYLSESAFGKGEHLGDGHYAVYNGSGNTLVITDLLPSSNYHFAVFEYNGTNQATIYQTQEFLQTSGSTVSAPTISGSQMLTNATSSSITLRWTKGNGTGRIVIVGENAVTTLPADLHAYTANAAFKSGAQTGDGQYVVYNASGSQVNITGLEADKLYYYAILERNGTLAPIYNKTDVQTGSVRTSTSLPVNWLYFRGRITPEGSLLEWATSEESNSACFVIERSLKPQSGFDAIDTVRAAGDSYGTRSYRFLDLQLGEMVYYRLRQIDRDGKYSFSKIININQEMFEIKLFPNPVTDQLYVSDIKTKAIVQIFSSAGKLMMQETTENNKPIQVSNLLPGIYLVVIEQGKSRLVRRIIKK